jgi:tyrosyl-tRNA synthetase
MTFPLITTSAGVKMGKTHKGAVWLDPKLTSPYEYYQYWINQDDGDIERFLALFTFIPMEEVRRLGALKGEEMREAKEILAYETTRLCHGEEEAHKAREAARQLFGGGAESAEGVPTMQLGGDELEKGIPAYILFERGRMCKTRGEARRLISQGGGYVNNRRITSFDEMIGPEEIVNRSILLRAGKKRFLRISVE